MSSPSLRLSVRGHCLACLNDHFILFPQPLSELRPIFLIRRAQSKPGSPTGEICKARAEVDVAPIQILEKRRRGHMLHEKREPRFALAPAHLLGYAVWQGRRLRDPVEFRYAGFPSRRTCRETSGSFGAHFSWAYAECRIFLHVPLVKYHCSFSPERIKLFFLPVVRHSPDAASSFHPLLLSLRAKMN